jgi:two-component SAPR family response regulator
MKLVKSLFRFKIIPIALLMFIGSWHPVFGQLRSFPVCQKINYCLSDPIFKELLGNIHIGPTITCADELANPSVIREKQPENAESPGKKKNVLIWLLIIFLFDVSALLVYVIKKKKKAERNIPVQEIPREKETESTLPEPHSVVNSEGFSNSIILFGSFHFYRSDGFEISSKFSPLLKELFLLILLNSPQNKRGITTLAIIEKLWPDMPDKNARNNLAVNIGKLRAILGSDFHDMLVNQNGSWRFEFGEKNNWLYCDYVKCLNLLDNKTEHSFNDIQLLVSIIRKGGLLVDLSYEWLDAFKAGVSNSIIDTLLNFAVKNKENVSADFSITIADTIMLFDMVNENAMELKCKALLSLGKHSMVSDTYSKFTKEYKTLYDVEYPRSLKSIIGRAL